MRFKRQWALHQRRAEPTRLFCGLLVSNVCISPYNMNNTLCCNFREFHVFHQFVVTSIGIGHLFILTGTYSTPYHQL